METAQFRSCNLVTILGAASLVVISWGCTRQDAVQASSTEIGDKTVPATAPLESAPTKTNALATEPLESDSPGTDPAVIPGQSPGAELSSVPADDQGAGPQTKGPVQPATFVEPEVDVKAPVPVAGYGAAAVARPPSPRRLRAPPQPLHDLRQPKVVLSETHASACRKQLGDMLPDLALKNLAGADTKLSKWLGERLTLVVFWTTEHVYAREQFSHLGDEVAIPFAGTGLVVAAIHVGPDNGDVAKLQEQYGGPFACLLDPDGKQFAQLAEAKMPRTYLLDKQGRILWMDIEYSRSTRRELANAVHFFLHQATDAE